MSKPFATIKRSALEHTLTYHLEGGDQVVNLGDLPKEERNKHFSHLGETYFKEKFKE